MNFAADVVSRYQVVRLKQVEHTLNEKKILQAISFPFLVSLEYHFKVGLDWGRGGGGGEGRGRGG